MGNMTAIMSLINVCAWKPNKMLIRNIMMKEQKTKQFPSPREYGAFCTPAWPGL